MNRNPFVTKQQRKTAERNRDELVKLFQRYAKDDPARERIRLRVIEAQEAVDSYK